MKQRRQYLLEKFLYDRCSQEELKELLSYLEDDEEKEYDEVLQQVWEQLQTYSLLDETAIARISEGVSSRIRSKTAAGKFRPLVSRPWFRYAATLTGLLMIVGAVYFLLTNHPSRIEHKTAYGETMKVVLPDSSVVTLNGNSHISYASVWEPATTREVLLEGEAFFEVRRQDAHKTKAAAAQQGNPPEGLKFIVHTPNFDVEVLGTSFNVNDRGDRASIVLRTGKVRLQKNDELAGIVMKPGDLVAFSRESNDLVTKTVDPDLYTSWTKNKLVFERTPLSEIARLLEDNYGLEVTLKDEHLQERIFTGTIPTMQVEVLLTILEESMQINIIRKGNQVMME
jgi:ferric-dicitrate binding protein FerR (iron transport regulator)